MEPAWLVDLDDTLVHSGPAQARAWRWWALRRRVDPATVLRIHGRTARDRIRECIPDISERDLATEVELMARIELDQAFDVRALPGAAQLLDGATQLAVVTSGGRELASARLTAAGLSSPAVMVTADDVTLGKPAAEPYMMAAALLGRDPSSCTVIEDAPAGIVSARAAGATRIVGVTTTHPRHKLVAAGAHVTAPHIAAYLTHVQASM